MESDALVALNLKNYLSFEEAKEDGEIELKRYEELKYLRRIPKEVARKEMKGGTISRLGLIIKLKDSGEKKRRVVIDLKRSGGNSLSRLPEKLTLPRVTDAVQLMKEMRKLTTAEEEADTIKRLEEEDHDHLAGGLDRGGPSATHESGPADGISVRTQGR